MVLFADVMVGTLVPLPGNTLVDDPTVPEVEVPEVKTVFTLTCFWTVTQRAVVKKAMSVMSQL